MQTIARHPAGRRGATAVLAALMLLALGGITALVSPQAQAAPNPGVALTIEPLVAVDANGTEYPGRPVGLEKPVRLRFSWDASGADVKPGDSYSIALPAEYRFREGGRHDDLLLGDGTKVGDCATTETTLTCTFNTAVSSATELKGSAEQVLMAQKVTQSPTATFEVNGTPVQVPHPASQPILPQAWVEKNLDKWANSLRRDSSAIVWHIQFSGSSIATHLGEPDGTVGSVTFNDVTGGDQQLDPDLRNWYVRVNPARSGGGPEAYFVVARADGTVHTTEHGTFALTPTIGADGRSASVTLTRTDGTFDPDVNYEIVYQSLAEGGRIVPGRVYTNTATLVGGAGTALTTSVSYKDLISYDVQLTQGYGSFGVKKYVTGAHQAQVPADTSVRVQVAYELPNGATEQDFPGWTNRPATNPYTVDVTVGQQQADDTLYQFPQGTRITLTEDTSGAVLPAPLGWAGARFLVNGTETADTTTFTVGRGVSAVGLYNEVVTRTGSFSVITAVEGDNKEVFGQEAYRVRYSCDGQVEGTLDVTGDGTPVEGPTLPVGTACTLAPVGETEDGGAHREGYTVTSRVDGGTFTVVEGPAGTTVVRVTHAYALIPAPQPPAPQPPAPAPAPTGAAAPTAIPTTAPTAAPTASSAAPAPTAAAGGPGSTASAGSQPTTTRTLARTGTSAVLALATAAVVAVAGLVIQAARRHSQ